ncbi:MAG: polyprenyl synthetase family protein [Acetatifactor sp.]|nr:polyprenyl synthetase family protein [Acetatifactor sp.]
MEQIQETIQRKAAEIEEIIKGYLPVETGPARMVLEAMNYSILAGGKRLRPMLMQETYRMFGGSGWEVEPLMAAIEMIHTYSLVHDDLPAMDNDEYRRGRKTTHTVYGEALGILAGDGLLNLAWETAMRSFSIERQEASHMQRIARAVAVLAQKAGVQGMIGGQTADMEAEEAEQGSLEQLLFIHEHKTAALIQAAMMAGAILAGAQEQQIRQMERCAYDIGVAFQIQDDILDITSTMEELGKPVGSDERNHKQTYVSLMGMEASIQEVERLSREAMEILSSVEGDSSFLQELTAFLIHRRK